MLSGIAQFMACCFLLSQTKIEKLCFLQVSLIAKPIARKETQETGNQELLNSLSENDKVEETGLNDTVESAENVEQCISTMYFKIRLYKFSKKMSSSQKIYVILQLFQNSMQKQWNIILIYYKINTMICVSLLL